MKEKLQLSIIALFYSVFLLAQPQGNTFNTASQASGSGLIPLWNINPTQPDLRWNVSINGITGTYNPAWHVTRPFTNWCAPGTDYAWIVNMYTCNPLDPTDHNCVTYPPPNNLLQVVQDLYYRIDFTLASSVYVIDLDFWADNKIVDVCVNSTSPIWTPNGGNFTTNGFINFKWCSNWVIGQNYIIVHVQSPMGNTGFMVKTNPVTPISINGPSNICQGSSGNNFSIPIVSGANTYAWTLPPTWSGSPLNTNATNVTAGSNSGNIYVTAHSGTACLASAVKPITILPAPILNINASNSPVCQNSPVTLTGSGGVSGTYNWSFPGGPSSLNPITVYPNATTIYNLSATGSNGCLGNQQIIVNVLPAPVVNVNAVPPFICNGSQNVLTASGTPGTNYVWMNPALGMGAIQVVSPNAGPVTYNVTGTSSNGCSSIGTITLNDGPIVSPIATNQILCTNAVTNTILTASSNFNLGPVNYNWTAQLPSTNAMMGTNNLSSLVVTPGGCNPNGNYPFLVTASSNAGCPGTAVAIVTVTDNCCSQPTTGLTPLTGNLSGNYSGASYFLENDISVSSGGWAKIQDAEILIMPNVKITVPANSKFVLEHAHLYACGRKMWQGIVIDDRGEINATVGSNGGSNLIEDAKVAIDVTGITTSHAQLPVNVFDVIFNRNHIGIQLSHSQPGVNSLNINVVNCVFTSRQLLFSTPAPFTSSSWDNTGTAFTPVPGLRYAFPGATSGLAGPYTILSVWNSIQNLKWPYDNQPGEIGIRIEDIGNTSGTLPAPGSGVNINAAITVNNNGFNIFDGIGVGIEVTDASLITNDNVFQNMQHYNLTPNCYTPPSNTWILGVGIAHKTTGLMNALLDLRPSPLFASGNRFWDCYIGVNTDNVFEVNIENAIFRSTQNLSSPFWHTGLDGIVLGSNRFKYNIKSNEFNNIEYGIWLGTSTGPYDIGQGPSIGTYADNVSISENYIGAQINSSTLLTSPPNISEYTRNAITLNGPGPSAWQMAGVCQIFSNKMDRVFGGIKINKMEDYPIEVGGNKIKIQDIPIPPFNSQYGILGTENAGNLVVNQNFVEAQGPGNTNVVGINMVQNQGVNSPTVTCNEVHNAYIGFEFAGNQLNTKWEGNTMYEPMTYGFSLVDYNFNPGVIGTQGSPNMSCGNYWLPSWLPSTPLQWFTRCINSNALQSVLYPDILVGSGQIPNHTGGPSDYNTVGTFITSGVLNANDCSNPNLYPTPPSQRVSNNSTSINTNVNDNLVVAIYPNPSSGDLTIKSTNGMQLNSVNILDITGKLVFSIEMNPDSENELDISSLKSGLYLIEIQGNNNTIIRKKLVKE